MFRGLRRWTNWYFVEVHVQSTNGEKLLFLHRFSEIGGKIKVKKFHTEDPFNSFEIRWEDNFVFSTNIRSKEKFFKIFKRVSFQRTFADLSKFY